METHGAPAELVGTLLQAQVLAAVLVALPLALVKTQQLITLERLTHSHALVSNILDSTTGTAILGTDLEGRIEFFNIGAERMTGYRADEVVGKATVAIVDFGDGRLRIAIGRRGAGHRAARRAWWARSSTATRRTTFTADWEFLRRDGEVRTISVAISRRYGEDGQPVGYLGVADDVTERRRHEAMVAAALETEKQIVERLAQVDQTKNDFMSTVSHELRTPITSIIGYSQLLISDDTGTLPAMHQQIIGRIERNGRRLMGLIEDMLTMSQVEVGSFAFHRAPIDLREPVPRRSRRCTARSGQRRSPSTSSCGPRRSRSTATPTSSSGSSSNLLSNAAKFSHAGDRISVHLGTERRRRAQRRRLRHRHRPRGPGAPLRPVLPRRRRHALAIQGVGLGLPIASSIVAGHDGRIDVSPSWARAARSSCGSRCCATGLGSADRV